MAPISSVEPQTLEHQQTQHHQVRQARPEDVQLVLRHRELEPDSERRQKGEGGDGEVDQEDDAATMRCQRSRERQLHGCSNVSVRTRKRETRPRNAPSCVGHYDAA